MNAKAQLNEKCQKSHGHGPKYTTERSKDNPGEDHLPNFDCKLTLPDGRTFSIPTFRGNKAEAEQELATLVLSQLNAEDLPEPRGRHASSTTSRDDKEVVTCVVARVVRQHANSVEATCRDVGGKVRLSGELAEGVRPGMLIEVRIKQPKGPD